MELKRVVVTGLGAVTPVGNTPEEMWKNLLAGVSGAAPLIPLIRLFHISSGVLPTGVTAPRPVTTTLFNSIIQFII